ncbi:hypothetical protein FRC01_002092 [Tulasnella sp. 417]|nr:hypothetical protein FRC01_002092 [Tulasnella sp. 417]
MASSATQAAQAGRGGPSHSQRRPEADSEDDEEDYGTMDYDDDDEVVPMTWSEWRGSERTHDQAADIIKESEA